MASKEDFRAALNSSDISLENLFDRIVKNSNSSWVLHSFNRLKECRYTLGEIADEAKSMDRDRIVALINDFDELIDKLEKLAGRGISGSFGEAFGDTVNSFKGRLEQELIRAKGAKDRAKEELQELREKIQESERRIEGLRLEKQQTIDEVRTGRVLREWPDHYLKYIRESEVRVRFWSLATPNVSNLFYWGDNLGRQERKWALWRSIWLMSLVFPFTLYLVWFLGSDVDISDWRNILFTKAAFVPLLVILSIAFAFSSRNYRIYANLLLQYRHKYTVAKVLENAVFSEAMKDKDDLRMEIMHQGLGAIFTLKSVGHLRRESVESISPREALDMIQQSK